MRYLLLILLLCGGCAPTPKRIVLNPIVRNNLNFLYDQVNVEFAFCAYGKINNELVWVKRIDLPLILDADEGSVQYGSCRGKDFLGYGHSHPRKNPCMLSDVDVLTLLNNSPPYGFLMCDERTFAVFSKREVKHEIENAGNQNLLLYLPPSIR